MRLIIKMENAGPSSEAEYGRVKPLFLNLFG